MRLEVDEVGALFEGDNLRVLGDLSQASSGSVRLCYLDPPFNTGEDFSYYGDSLPSTVWFEELVSRLLVVRDLLADNGSIWLHLDDREQHYGRVALDLVFGREAFVATVVWQKRTSRENRKAFSHSQDYIHVYAPMGPKRWKLERNGYPNIASVSYDDGDSRGPWRSVPLSAQAGHGTPQQFYSVTSPSGEVLDPPPGRCWAYSRERFLELEADGRIYWPRNGRGRPRLKRFISELNDLAPDTMWFAADVGDNAEAKRELMRALPGRVAFDTPKPIRLMERIIQIATSPGDLVLDPYLGSGSTAVAAHRLGRRWVGIERESRTIEHVTLPRLAAEGLAAEVRYVALRDADEQEDPRRGLA